MLDIKTNSNDCPFFSQPQSAIAQSTFPVNNDLLNGAIDPFNTSGYSAESSLTNPAASSFDRQTQIADFIVGNAGDIFSFSASDRVTGDVADDQLKPQSQSTNANAAVSRTLNRSSLFPTLPDLGGNNWALDVINAPEVWNQNITGNGIVVAVVDSGVDYTHPDLDGNIWRNADEIAGNGIDDDRNGYVDDIRGWDFVANDNDPIDLDFDGHGTHIAGSIAAERNNFGVTGIAYNAKIMPVRVLPAFGSGQWNNVAAGIRYAADNGANVINLSLGNEFYPLNQVNDAIEFAIQYANNKGSVVVMSAGNSGDIQPGYPARNANRLGIAVGSIDVRGTMDNSSNRSGSTPLDYLVAPGIEIFSTTPDDEYGIKSGTSFSTPQVAGVAALVLSANPNLTPSQVEYILTTTANRNGLIG